MQHDFLSLPGHRDGAPALAPAAHPASARCARSSGSRAGTAARPRDRRRHDLPRVHGRVRAAIVRAAVARPGAGRALAEQVGRRRCSTIVSSPWRFQERLLELWDEGDPTWFASPQHPQGRPGTTSRWSRSSRRSTGSRSASAATRQVALGPRARGRVHAPVRRGEPALPAHLQPHAWRPAGRARPSRRTATCRRSRSRACGDPCTGWSPTSATRAARAGS